MHAAKGILTARGGMTSHAAVVARGMGRPCVSGSSEIDINYENKEVVVIGSGATAATIVPELAKKTKHTTMLQRSPTYFVSAPDEDYLANNLSRFIPERLAYAFIRIRNIFFQNLTHIIR